MSRKRQKLDRPFKRRPYSEADLQRGIRQHGRIETLVDCVYALVIVLIVSALPYPADEGLTAVSVGEFVRTHVDDYMPAITAIVLVVLYWTQNNILFGNLSRTDDRHSVISLLQIFFLLFYLYSIELGLDLDNPPSALALQSGAVVLVGLCSFFGWSYASRNRRLLTPEMSVAEIRKVRVQILAEPLTALITLMCAPLGQTAWQVAWLFYPLVAWIVKRMAGGDA